MNAKKSYNRLEKYFTSVGIDLKGILTTQDHPFLQNINDEMKRLMMEVISDGVFIKESVIGEIIIRQEQYVEWLNKK